MSKKSWFKRTSKIPVALPKAAPADSNPPRSKEEIQRDYAQLCANAGELQFRILNSKAQLNQINNTIQQLDGEMRRRNQIDEAEAAKTVTAPASTAQESSDAQPF